MAILTKMCVLTSVLRSRIWTLKKCHPLPSTFLPTKHFSTTLVARDTSNGPWLSATPRVCLHDVPTILRAGGLKPNAPVTLTADLLDENGKQFCSHAHYISDAEGDVDVTLAPSVGGSYKGVFPAGLLTTLAPAPHEFPLLRLYRRDPQLPWKITVKVVEGHQPLGSQQEAVSEVHLERHLMGRGVRRVPLREGRVRATLFLPPGPGPFPGVIDMFGTAGGLMEFRAAMMASRGIATMALAYFAFEDLPKTTERFDLEYFAEAAELLMSQEGVVPDRCGIVGVSKAADIAFTLATWMAEVKAVVSISGSPVAYDSIITYQGKTILEGFKMDMSVLRLDEHGRLYPLREMIQLLTPDHPKFIPINLADDDTYFLVVGGDDDAWSCDVPVHSVRERMEMFGRTEKLETKVYPGAGHILEPPYGALIHHSYHRHLPVVGGEDGSERVTGVPILWGGQPAEHCAVQEDLWPRMRNFLMKHIRDESPWYQQHKIN
ncbi:acyl-coenzyme A thioesterase 1-like isoform X1 [Penaeus japonicus]|uniref:acyl-coenzyme A thioesterase 1-like isoform X1 n=1 Tax=Penaeus japonicus TaxID=27405 RepID=UPI001C713D02|nr:acyl-coenzyme A thioesterase 1-like isoform X1 [Penaeus japonicus]XP_042862625.1 acyl-coenzyme A thioesterase 1-like isoform X1 [Penaeus japonicus]XP_042862633.1 acyl-coenzyme A thioesterase 1-like isoform X1 [Penaeus japonicus]XP_042862642.1 acyl-coenzyme A thioesterase 1-like isoform X1 [Penaeus japonicus]XP_042862651.1 acyl-coenzyme A thioesterase 1-like isoform X1 [Penaeus japonicus]XP_042862660.1 acyl-coenzyme A thioesterase 1-like isoform X1 [Penaeus japonicus]